MLVCVRTKASRIPHCRGRSRSRAQRIFTSRGAAQLSARASAMPSFAAHAAMSRFWSAAAIERRDVAAWAATHDIAVD
jgi:hypothetical protein